MITVCIKMFNSVGRFAPGKRYFKLALPYNETVGELIKQLKVPEKEIFLVLHNGKNIMRYDDLNSIIDKERIIRDGDVLALSGPVTRSRCHGVQTV